VAWPSLIIELDRGNPTSEPPGRLRSTRTGWINAGQRMCRCEFHPEDGSTNSSRTWSGFANMVRNHEYYLSISLKLTMQSTEKLYGRSSRLLALGSWSTRKLNRSAHKDAQGNLNPRCPNLNPRASNLIQVAGVENLLC
jgi:hypothetical protein